MPALESLKPFLTALVLPPVPWLLLMLLGLRWIRLRPRLGRTAIVAGVVLIWLSTCMAPARWLHGQFGFDLPALDAARLAALKADEASVPTAILVLGSGMTASVDDPRLGELNRSSLERLRAGVRLARATSWPLAFSGGRGWAQIDNAGDSEAQAAQRSAARDFGQPLAWIEPDSRDTAENAQRSVALLRGRGVRRVVIVTHDWHMPRALALFERAAARDAGIVFIAAPLASAGAALSPGLEWMPSSEGADLVRTTLREGLAALVLGTTSTAVAPGAAQQAAP